MAEDQQWQHDRFRDEIRDDIQEAAVIAGRLEERMKGLEKDLLKFQENYVMKKEFEPIQALVNKFMYTLLGAVVLAIAGLVLVKH